MLYFNYGVLFVVAFQRLSSTDTAVTATSSVLPPRHRGSVPANLDPETADLVRMQMEDHGTNMFVALTPADDPEIERLTAAGYQYNEALLEIFNYRYPPLRAYDGYPPVAPGAAMNQSFYQQSALPPQYAVPAPQPYYGGPQVQGYVSQQAYYMQPQAGPQPVMHSRSFYQVPGPSHMVMPDGTRVPIDSEDNGLYPIDYAPSRKASGHARKPSGGGSSSAGSVAGGGGRPPVINGSQTLLEQRRQDAKRAAQVSSHDHPCVPECHTHLKKSRIVPPWLVGEGESGQRATGPGQGKGEDTEKEVVVPGRHERRDAQKRTR